MSARLWARLTAAAVMASGLLAIPAVARSAAVHPAAAPIPGHSAVRPSGPVFESSASLAVPGAMPMDDAMSGVSCALQRGQTNPFGCRASGFYAFFPTGRVMGSGWFWNGRLWEGTGEDASGAGDQFGVILLQRLSCSALSSDQVTCLDVGEHYSRPSAPVQLAEFDEGGGMLPLTTRDPAGTTWSVMNDVACTSWSSCLTVGAAGITRPGRHGTEYYGHGTAYEWNGRTLSRLAVPRPARAGYSELTGVSCADPADCMAVGNYLTARGKWRTFAAQWVNRKWHLRATPVAPGRDSTRFTAISCPVPGQCLAVGNSSGARLRPFAAIFRGGRWHASATVRRAGAELTAVSCPAASACVAVGSRQGHPLAAAWNGSRWIVQPTPALHGQRPDGKLLGVYCFTKSRCFATGYRYSPKIRYSRTLAAGWNGKSWKMQVTANY
jgi:hypothetical protein